VVAMIDLSEGPAAVRTQLDLGLTSTDWINGEWDRLDTTDKLDLMLATATFYGFLCVADFDNALGPSEGFLREC
jgi:hypothetical protein